MTSAASEVARIARDWLEQRYPGAILPFPLMDSLDTFNGFGVATPNAVALLFIDSTDAAEWNWTLSVYGGIAIDVPGVTNCLHWANMKNRASAVGKYHIATHREQQTSVLIGDYSIQGVHIEAAVVRNSGLAGHIRGLLSNAVAWTEEDAREVLTTLGGRSFPPDEASLQTIFMAGSSG
jgi:hypothetical protein